MPDGSRPPLVELMMPDALVHRAESVFGRAAIDRPRVVAMVHWMMFLRGDAGADPAWVANHYALWCFDTVYYKAFSRMTL